MNDNLQKHEFERDRYLIETIKTILTLASGTFIVSLGFISTKMFLSYKGLLFISWLYLIISIYFGIKALNAGIKRYDRSVRGIKNELNKKEKELYEKGKVLTTFESITPDLQEYSFYIGLFSVFLFVIVNINSILKW